MCGCLAACCTLSSSLYSHTVPDSKRGKGAVQVGWGLSISTIETPPPPPPSTHIRRQTISRQSLSWNSLPRWFKALSNRQLKLSSTPVQVNAGPFSLIHGQSGIEASSIFPPPFLPSLLPSSFSLPLSRLLPFYPPLTIAHIVATKWWLLNLCPGHCALDSLMSCTNSLWRERLALLEDPRNFSEVPIACSVLWVLGYL